MAEDSNDFKEQAGTVFGVALDATSSKRRRSSCSTKVAGKRGRNFTSMNLFLSIHSGGNLLLYLGIVGVHVEGYSVELLGALLV